MSTQEVPLFGGDTCMIDDRTGAIVIPTPEGDPVVTAPAVNPSSSDPKDQIFPYTLDDLAFWIIKRKDGIVVKYNVVEERPIGKGTWKPLGSSSSVSSYPKKSFSDWCHHDPIGLPVWDDGETKIWIADSQGCQKYRKDFDVVLDCGNILTLTKPELVAVGDPELCKLVNNFAPVPNDQEPAIVKIHWFDREAPPLDVDVWAALAKAVKGKKVLTACQGGHGRSGTSLVCLMMALNPEYTPYHAITHLRAIHCPRAIESHVQHEYIDLVGDDLGREMNAQQVKSIKDFKKEFLGFDLKSAKVYQDRLTSKKDAK